MTGSNRLVLLTFVRHRSFIYVAGRRYLIRLEGAFQLQKFHHPAKWIQGPTMTLFMKTVQPSTLQVSRVSYYKAQLNLETFSIDYIIFGV